MGILSLIKNKWFETSKPDVILPRPYTNPKKVKPLNRTLYEKRGWVGKGNSHKGYFRTKYGAWFGTINKRGDIFEVYIFDPPKEKLKLHRKWECFVQKNKEMYKVHLNKQPKGNDVSSIIFYIERILIESHQLF